MDVDMLREVSRWAHVVAGVVAFGSLWTAGFSRKGGRLHRRAGSIYVWTLTFVLLTAAILAATEFMRGKWMGGVFLIFLLTITGTALWTGRRALRYKGDAAGYTRGLYAPVGVLNLAAASGALGVGVLAGEYFIMGISAIGFLIGFGMLAWSRNPPTHPRFWLKEHFGGMIAAGVASHIAFASIGLRQLFPEANTSVTTIWPWAAPLAIGFVASMLAEWRYIAHETALPSDR